MNQIFFWPRQFFMKKKNRSKKSFKASWFKKKKKFSEKQGSRQNRNITINAKLPRLFSLILS
jgi:hypothetical protein